MILRISLIALAALVLTGCPLKSRYTVEVENLTDAQPLSPVTLLTHNQKFELFNIGQPASIALEKLAEAGNNKGVLKMKRRRAVARTYSADAPLAPGQTDSFKIKIRPGNKHYLSVAAMLVNTNDAFVADTGIDLSTIAPGESVTLTLPVWDAGTEANSESQATIPGPAAQGEGFNTVRDDTRDAVRIHAGVISADDGKEDSVLSYRHRFLNPAAKVTITRNW